VLVERLGGFVEGMYQQAANADGVGGGEDPRPASCIKDRLRPKPWYERSTARRASTTTGMGSGMLRRSRPVASSAATALDAKA
jgi:hypothetical protein